jgi:hypothetical protein
MLRAHLAPLAVGDGSTGVRKRGKGKTSGVGSESGLAWQEWIMCLKGQGDACEAGGVVRFG